MEITWLAHSCFRLRGDGATVLTDPFPDSLGAHLGTVQPTIVTVSHDHPNHNHWQETGNDVHLINGPGEYAISGVYIKGTMTSPTQSDPPQKRNTAYSIEMDGLALCHLGDLSGTISAQQVNELTPVDVLFLPAGGVCTLDVGRVTEILQSLNPSIVIPMHYHIPGLTVQLEGLERFLKEMGLAEAEPQPRLTVTRSNLPAESRVVVLRPLGVRTRSP